MRSRAADRGAVVALDVVGVVAVVARDEHRFHIAGHRIAHGRRLPEPAPEPARPLAADRDRAQREMVNLRHDRPGELDRVVLLGLGAEVHQVVGRIVDAADEGALAVDHHDLAVHAAEHVQALAEEAMTRIEHAHLHAGLAQFLEELAREIGRAEAVDHQVDLHAAPCRLAHRGVQVQTHLVLEQDEGLDDHLALRGADRLEHARKELLAVLQQLDAVARDPGIAVAHGWMRLQRSISATSGAWSDRCDQGRRGSTTGACTPALRT